MLNALRLNQAISYKTIHERCFIDKLDVLKKLTNAEHDGLVVCHKDALQITNKGLLFLNDILLNLLQPTD
jgi:coproporphyrinogen III oxidase-like Fe-S oxidoreductase